MEADEKSKGAQGGCGGGGAGGQAQQGNTVNESFIMFKQERSLENMRDRLYYIYVILCSIYNMKPRSVLCGVWVRGVS